MAGKGGGAWKVAYADFVTAMMAFFMVMWLMGQDQKIKKAVAYYFTDPLGASKKAGKTGAVSQNESNGAVPQSEQVAMGTGRHAFSAPDDTSQATKLVNDYVHADKERFAHWKEQARRQRDAAARTPEVKDGKQSPDELAAQLLAKQMREEFSKSIPNQAGGVYQDLLFDTLTRVNWTELAEEMLRR